MCEEESLNEDHFSETLNIPLNLTLHIHLVMCRCAYFTTDLYSEN